MRTVLSWWGVKGMTLKWSGGLSAVWTWASIWVRRGVEGVVRVLGMLVSLGGAQMEVEVLVGEEDISPCECTEF